MKSDSVCPLRVAVLGSTYPRSPDDPGVPWLRESVRRAAASGHEVTVIAPAYKGLCDHTIDGVPVVRFRYGPAARETLTHDEGAPSKLRRGSPVMKLLAAVYVLSGMWTTLRVCYVKKIELLHVHWPFPHGLMALAPAMLLGVKVVSTCHSAELALAKKGRVASALLRLCLRRSDLVCANSAHTAAMVKENSGVDAVVIPYGATVTPREGGEAVDPTAPMLLFCGRLIQRKGVGYLLEAMPEILRRHPSARLVITGEGDCKAAWEALATKLSLGDRVRFAGFVSNEELAELYAACTVYVHPAIIDDQGDTEGLGVVLVEALANRKPVVASRVGGIVDVIRHEDTGLLVPEKDPLALAEAVCRVLDAPEYAAGLAERGLAHARSYFDWDRITRQLNGVYALVTGTAPAPGKPQPRDAGPNPLKHAA